VKVIEPTGPFVLRLPEVLQGDNPLDRTGSAADLSLDPAYMVVAGPIEFVGNAYRAGDHVEVKGRVSAEVDLCCDRCLATFRRVLEPEIRVFAERRESRDRRPEEEVREDDLGIVYHDGRFVDLTDEVRQALLVELPWHTVCKDGCPGLCPRCGADLNEGPCRCGDRVVDVRWVPLLGSDPGNGGSRPDGPGDRG
jgi:uncharacterized protein